MPATNHALLVIDIQNDFCESGALAVPDASSIISGINDLAGCHDCVVLTQDWHPPNHSSFASQHQAHEPYAMISMHYGEQTLWPDHCVQGTTGAAFHDDLHVGHADLIIRKGFNKHIDSYSAFFENDRTTATGLEGYLRSRGIKALTLVGLATDFCVRYSAEDAARLGFDVTVNLDLCRGIDLHGSMEQALTSLRTHGVNLV